MDYKKLSLGLGFFSLALGATELLGAKSIAKALDADDHSGIVKGFGIRELAAGFAILAQPAVATGVWGRVVGDVMDIVATSGAAKNSPRNKSAWGALAFVIGATALDVWVAIGLDKETGKTLPTHPPLPA
ncbi:hypothetical protein [uncultured Sphingomonas sp.]|uniref:hypothetical protein n=1 Tax=uncultured Sphingomonas sp. TaxID=158754 RepID=UPI0035CB5208